MENIDIGGPSMVRSAAKNFQDVAVVTGEADYQAIATEMLPTREPFFRDPVEACPGKRSP